MTPIEYKSAVQYTACVIAPAQERTAKEYGLTQAALHILLILDTLTRQGSEVRAKTLVQSGYSSYPGMARSSKVLRAKGLIAYQPKSRRAVVLTTAGKLCINAYHRTIEREIKRLQSL